MIAWSNDLIKNSIASTLGGLGFKPHKIPNYEMFSLVYGVPSNIDLIGRFTEKREYRLIINSNTSLKILQNSRNCQETELKQ